MTVLLSLLGLIKGKVALYGGMALAVVLVLLGAYRKGAKAQAAAAETKFRVRLQRDIETKEEIADEIRTAHRDGRPSAVDRLRSDWSR